MLIKRITFFDFVVEFEKYGRGDQFSNEGKEALYYYLSEISEDIGEPIELDIVGLCCEFTEYGSIEEFNEDCGYNVEDLVDLENHTAVIEIDGGKFIVQNF